MARPFMGFSPESFSERRARVRTRLEGGAMILPAAQALLRSRDTEHRYRPDSELFYLTGSVDPGVTAVLRDSDEEGFVLFVPEPDHKREVWSGPRMSPEEAKERLRADAVYPAHQLEEHLPRLLRSSSRIFFRLGLHAALEKVVLGALAWARGRGSRTGEGPRSVIDPGEILDQLRLIKDAGEIEAIRRVTSLTTAAFREAIGLTRPGVEERVLEACLESAFRRGGAAGPAFPTIVGSGQNGCVLHYVDNADKVAGGDLVLLDGGAEMDLYAGDLTRTFPASGRFSGPQLDVYQIVLAAHGAAMGQVRPGATVASVHDAALQVLTGGLVALGILEGAVEDLIEGKAYEPYAPHQTSHWLGLDVHDAGDYATAGASKLLEPGMVLTVEPGLYFPRTSQPWDHAFGGIGVRIEDDLLVTEKGAENLTGGLPVDPEALAALVGIGSGP